MLPLRPTPSQRLAGLFWPVRVREESTPVNPTLELLWFRGRWQLATEDALYSDGAEYRPVLAAFRGLRREVIAWKSVLMLGSGLGSAVDILRKKNKAAQCTLVEIDPVVLGWALEVMDSAAGIVPVCEDAKTYMAGNSAQYDAIIADIFESRRVPRFVTGDDFLKRCREALAGDGVFILNTMAAGEEETAEIRDKLDALYRAVECVSFGINRVFIAKA